MTIVVGVAAFDRTRMAGQVTHLALPIADEQRTCRFYETYFGFDPATASLHFGFRVAESDDVRALLVRREPVVTTDRTGSRSRTWPGELRAQ